MLFPWMIGNYPPRGFGAKRRRNMSQVFQFVQAPEPWFVPSTLGSPLLKARNPWMLRLAW
jgi:hypothetical protein